jgi:hypothetical protein
MQQAAQAILGEHAGKMTAAPHNVRDGGAVAQRVLEHEFTRGIRLEKCKQVEFVLKDWKSRGIMRRSELSVRNSAVSTRSDWPYCGLQCGECECVQLES